MTMRSYCRSHLRTLEDEAVHILRELAAEREDGEVFNAYAARVGTKEFEDAVRDLAMPAEFGLETMNEFIDWNRNVPFEVIRGEGECAV